MGEQRCPFKSGRPVSISSANQLVLAVGKFDEFGLTELTDHLFPATCSGPNEVGTGGGNTAISGQNP